MNIIVLIVVAFFLSLLSFCVGVWTTLHFAAIDIRTMGHTTLGRRTRIVGRIEKKFGNQWV